jgi:hypothetical protein
MEKVQFQIAKNKSLEVELIRKNVKNINLTIRPDLSITLSANQNISEETIREYLQKKSEWLMKRMGKYQQTKSENIVEREYVSGESYKFLGKQYRLLVEFTSSTERVFLSDGYLSLYVHEKRKNATKARLLDDWYRERALSEFNDSLLRIFPLVSGSIETMPSIQFKIMKKRWGSCLRSKGVILLNFELIKAPKYCIDYVMIHELLHFIRKNHDSQFYDLLTVLMPDWKERKEILDENVVLFV